MTSLPRSTRMLVALVALASTLAVVPLGVLVATPAAHAAGPACPPSDDWVGVGPQPDFDGDNQPDVALGAPNRPGGGAVLVRSYCGATVRWTRLTLASIGRTNAGYERFGTVVKTLRIDGDRYSDLVVSAPGTSDLRGLVYVVFGAPGGLGTGRPAIALGPSTPSTSQADDFGSALAMDRSTDGTDLVVGAPGTTLKRSAPEAGAVYRFVLRANGTVAQRVRYVQGSHGVPGKAERLDHFGAVVDTARPHARLMIYAGAPDEGLRRGGKNRVAAGAVTVIDTRTGKASAITQDTTGVPGASESGDFFGSALDTTAFRVAIGAPGEDVGRVGNAGAATVVTMRSTTGGYGTTKVESARSYTLDTKGVQGVPHQGDELGRSVLIRLTEREVHPLLVAGAPGRDVNGIPDAGSVTFFATSTSCERLVASCGRTISRASRGIGGRAQSFGRFGTTLGRWGDPDLEEDEFDSVVVGAPNEDQGGMNDIGRFTLVQPNGRRSFELEHGRAAGDEIRSAAFTDADF